MARIRPYEPQDRQALRDIACDTAFFCLPPGQFIDDRDLLADALTMHFTDYEPESCFVAVADGRVVGYATGTRNVRRMNALFFRRVLPRLWFEAFRRGSFFKKNTRRFLRHMLISFFKGEFFTPNFTRRYPAALHVNVAAGYQRQHIGRELIGVLLDYLRRHKAGGVHFGTSSEAGQAFFKAMGFEVLYEGHRTYLRYALGRIVPYRIFGKLLS